MAAAYKYSAVLTNRFNSLLIVSLNKGGKLKYTIFDSGSGFNAPQKIWENGFKINGVREPSSL